MIKIALATYANQPQLTKDDQRLIPAFEELGVEAIPAVWDDKAVDWSTFNGVVIRSTWDYHLKPDAFRTWIKSVESEKLLLFNPPEMLLWNMDKRYLIQLADASVNIIATRIVSNAVSLEQLLEENGWNECVIKPAVSASAYDTWATRCETASADQARFEAAIRKHGYLLVQPFVHEIRDGEYSIVFFNGSYSHTVKKRPPHGAIFVQPELGGTSSIVNPPEWVIKQAYTMLEAAENIVNQSAVYVRVDAVIQGDQLALMELELIEPALYLGASEEAPRQFATALISRLMG